MYIASDKRYENMKYKRCGESGLLLPEVSLGLWHNFGDTGVYANMEQMALSWLLKEEVITSVLVGASKPAQILDTIKAVENTQFTKEELEEIDQIVFS